MQPEKLPGSSENYGYIGGEGVMNAPPYVFPVDCDFPALQSYCSSSFYPLEVSAITDSPQDRALAASRNHKEAEKRRRERINSHLDKLRTLLPCNSKTDKASLLAKVIQRVKELKRQTSEIPELEILPCETDEVSVLTSEFSGEGELIIKASLCCEDRSDLLSDLIETLKSLNLKTVRAEMATLGGRIRNVLVVAGDGDRAEESVGFLRNALKSLVEGSSSSDRSKRRRLLDRRAIIS